MGGWLAKSPTTRCQLHGNVQSKSMSTTPRGGGWVAKSPTNDCPLHVNMQSKSMSPNRGEGGWLAKSPPNQCQLQRASPRAQKWALGPILLSQPLLNPFSTECSENPSSFRIIRAIFHRGCCLQACIWTCHTVNYKSEWPSTHASGHA